MTNQPLPYDREQVSDTISDIIRWHRTRSDWLRVEGDAIRRMGGLLRRDLGGDKGEAYRQVKLIMKPMKDNESSFVTEKRIYLMPIIELHGKAGAEKKRAEKFLRPLARKLPVWQWVGSVHGFGEIGLTQIIGEAGDLWEYPTYDRLWKRFGLACIDGERQHRVKGRSKADKEKAIRFGFSPTRRSIIHVIGDSLMKKQNPYRDLYLERKALEAWRYPEAKKGQHHMRALRYMEKRLMRDLWRAWRKAEQAAPNSHSVECQVN